MPPIRFLRSPRWRQRHSRSKQANKVRRRFKIQFRVQAKRDRGPAGRFSNRCTRNVVSITMDSRYASLLRSLPSMANEEVRLKTSIRPARQ